MPAVKKRKPSKPRRIEISCDGWCNARASIVGGHTRTIFIKGYPTKPAKVKQLAKWFADAEKWLGEEGK